jgi:hypothetical protein
MPRQCSLLCFSDEAAHGAAEPCSESRASDHGAYMGALPRQVDVISEFFDVDADLYCVASGPARRKRVRADQAQANKQTS